MKKMVPLIIFLVVLVIVCFAGCANFTTVLGGEDSVTEAEIQAAENAETIVQTEVITQAMVETVTDAQGNEESTVVYYQSVPVTQENGEKVTDAQGNEETTLVHYDPSTTVPATSATQVNTGDNTTKQSGKEENTTKASQTASGTTEYDILRSGNFYMVGSMFDGSTTLPLETAITANTIYMNSEMDGLSVGILVDAEKKVYMIIPEKKIYLELSDAVMKYMGVSSDDLIASDSIDFSKYPPLEEADSVNDVELNGTKVKEYVFDDGNGSTTRVYMNGSKLVRYAGYDSSGELVSAGDVTSITSQVPDDKKSAPSGYKGYSGITGLIGFMSQMADLME